MCTTSTVTLVGASLEESVPVPCKVNADPSDVSFEWTFSSSGEHYEVPPGHYSTVQEASTTGNRPNEIDLNGTQHIYLDGKFSIFFLFKLILFYRFVTEPKP